jgi:hypothetical protein
MPLIKMIERIYRLYVSRTVQRIDYIIRNGTEEQKREAMSFGRSIGNLLLLMLAIVIIMSCPWLLVIPLIWLILILL